MSPINFWALFIRVDKERFGDEGGVAFNTELHALTLKLLKLPVLLVPEEVDVLPLPVPEYDELFAQFPEEKNFGHGVQQVNYTNFPLCLTPPGDTKAAYSNMCIVGFASPAVGSFK